MPESRIHFPGKELVVAMPPHAVAQALWQGSPKPVELETSDGPVLVNPDAVLYLEASADGPHGRASW